MSTFDPQAWNQTDPDSGFENNDPPTPGTYTVMLNDGRAFTSKKGDDFVSLNWKIVAGDQADYTWDALYNFKNEGAFKATKAVCQRIGIDVDSIASLEDLSQKIVEKTGKWFEVEVKQNGEWRNTYVNGAAQQTARTDAPAETSEFAHTSVGADDDIPF